MEMQNKRYVQAAKETGLDQLERYPVKQEIKDTEVSLNRSTEWLKESKSLEKSVEISPKRRLAPNFLEYIIIQQGDSD